MVFWLDFVLCYVQKEIDLGIEADAIIVHPVKKKPRQGWAEKFELMHSRGEDKLLVNDALDLEWVPGESKK